MGLRSASLAALAALLAIGVFAAFPFFDKGLVGTGESYNYSLSVADALVQMRHGVMPPLAGQTEYAFNGRIHPLRNAPYLHYLCAAIDFATLHRLPVWQVQNASLAFSLIAALLSCYYGLRWATGCPRAFAVFLAAVYALAPPLMGAAFNFDLYMTVHAAVFVPLAIAASVRGGRSPSFSNDAWLAASLAAAWLTHPPVAFWLTVSSVVIRMVAFVAQPRLWILVSGLVSGVLGIVLASFAFVSAATLSPDLGYLADKPEMWRNFPDILLDGLKGTFPGSILPISAGAGSLSDLQLGYVSWVLLGLVVIVLLRKSQGRDSDRPLAFSAAGCAVAAMGLLILDLPVPLVTHWAWRHMPAVVLELTTQWPMQRLYLVAVGLCVFGAGAALPERWRSLGAPRWVAPLGVVAAFGWILFQARPFLIRGLADQRSVAVTESLYRPSNLDLTITSYAFVGPPPTYMHGVVDPLFEFRLLRNGVDEISSPLAAGTAAGAVVQTGAIRLATGLAPGRSAVGPKLTLLPGHRYLLSLDFRVPPVKAYLTLRGPLLDRGYILPEAGEAKGFGMLDGQRRTISVWTDSPKPEQVDLQVAFPADAVFPGRSTVFADITLRDVARDTLPVRIESLLPLRFTVDAPQAGCTVETPRRFIPGYAATVNGKPVTVFMSPYRQVMVPVPAGRSVVELSYPGPVWVRRAFALTVWAWALFWVWRAMGSWVPRPWAVVSLPARIAWRFRWWLLGAALVAAAVAHSHHIRAREQALRDAVGPVRMVFQLPYGKTKINEPLLSTGHVGAGVVVFAQIVDERHVRIGADVWGSLYETEPMELDFSVPHELVVSDGALYPLDNPRIRDLKPEEAERLRSQLVVELDGRTVIHEIAHCYESTREEIQIGHAPFGSLTGRDFRGIILESERLPLPQTIMLPASRHARMSVKFPKDRIGLSEPILAMTAGPRSCQCSAAYLAPNRLRLFLSSLGEPTLSADITYDPDGVHKLDFWPSADESGNRSFVLCCAFDGKQVLGPATPKPIGRVPVLETGLNIVDATGVQARFTGPLMETVLLSDSGLPEGDKIWGAAEVVVSFPLNKDGRHEPILTTGNTGAGDFIYVVYVDATHIRLGFDHWGGGAGQLSDPIEIDYHAPHEIWISMAPLYPDKPLSAVPQGLTPSDRAALASKVSVALDEKLVISETATVFPSDTYQVTFFENRIGGSTADPKFSGVVYYLGRITPSSRFP